MDRGFLVSAFASTVLSLDFRLVSSDFWDGDWKVLKNFIVVLDLQSSLICVMVDIFLSTFKWLLPYIATSYNIQKYIYFCTVTKLYIFTNYIVVLLIYFENNVVPFIQRTREFVEKNTIVIFCEAFKLSELLDPKTNLIHFVGKFSTFSII